MSRRFSNLQYVSIGILFGTCVFLWARKLNLTGKTFPENHATSNLRQTPRSENEERLIDSWADNKVEPEDQISSLLEEEDDTNNALEDNPISDHLRPKDRIVLDSSKEILLLTNNTSEFQEVSKGIEIVLSDPSPAYLPELERTDPLEPMLDPVTPTEDTTESENYDSSSSPSAKTTSDAIQTLSSTSVIPSGN